MQSASCEVSYDFLLFFTGSVSGNIFDGADFKKSARLFYGGVHKGINVSWSLVSLMQAF